MTELEIKASKMLERCDVVNIASITNDGYPRPIPMSKIHAIGYSEVWLATGKESLKTVEYTQNCKAGLSYYEAGNSVVITGRVEIITDMSLLKQHWQEWFIKHFPDGVADPNYILLKFTGEFATIYIDDQFVRQPISL